MAEQQHPVSETALGYEVFRPMWSLLEVGAARSANQPELQDFSLSNHVTEHRAKLDQLLALVAEIGTFSPATMRIFEEQGGWHGEAHLSTMELAAHLLMSCGYLEEFPPNLADASVVTRMLDAAVDRQLTDLLNALVGSAIHRHPDHAAAVPLIAESVRTAGELAGTPRHTTLRDAVRLWRVAVLPAVLRPDSPTPQTVRTALRIFVHALEAVPEP